MTERRQGRFGAVVTAMVTPFDESGKLDFGGAQHLANHLVATGSDALVLAGTTGEGPALSDAERRDLWHAVAEISHVPVIAGSTTNDTAHSVELTWAAEAAGVAGILAVTPYYNRPSQVGIARHFTAVAEASVAAGAPSTTSRSGPGGRSPTETVLRLARETRNILGVKDAAGDVAGSAALMADAPAGFDLYSGDDSLTLPLLSVGAVGVVSVGRPLDRPRAGHNGGGLPLPATSRTASAAGTPTLIDAVAFQSSDEAPNPLPAKAMMRALGLPCGRVPAPSRAGAGLARGAGRGSPGGLRLGGPAGLVAERVRVAFLGGLGEIGRNCAVLEQAGRPVVLDCGVSSPNLEMPGVDLVLPDFSDGWPSGTRTSTGSCSPTGTRTTSVALAYLLPGRAGAGLRLRPHARHRPEPPRRGRTSPSRRTWSRCTTASAARSGRSRSSSSPSLTPCPMASPSPSTPPRASSCTAATSSSTSHLSTAGAPTWPVSDISPTKGSGCSCRIRRMLRNRASPAASVRSGSRSGPSSRRTVTTASSWRASPVTSIASSSSSTPPSPRAAASPSSAGRW